MIHAHTQTMLPLNNLVASNFLIWRRSTLWVFLCLASRSICTVVTRNPFTSFHPQNPKWWWRGGCTLKIKRHYACNWLAFLLLLFSSPTCALFSFAKDTKTLLIFHKSNLTFITDVNRSIECIDLRFLLNVNGRWKRTIVCSLTTLKIALLLK